ncbi:tachykinin-3a isoform X2 [Cynoglossus semilaevis]|nr:tachykinin-3-like isoform X2 [Cynoglossus semilaevis]
MFSCTLGGAGKMRRGFLLVTLVLVVKLRCGQSRCEEAESSRSTSDHSTGLEKIKRSILKRYNDWDYDSFVGLMGRRNTDENNLQSQQKREMHDIFVGLMGRRSSESDNGPWRRAYPERRGISLHKCKLR